MKRTLLVAWLALASAPAGAQEAPFDAGFERLAQVMGSLHFLSTLCGRREGEWREAMEGFMEAEAPDPERRARFTAGFNRGYQAFASTYRTCTPSATAAIDLYRAEGERLARALVDRYGN